MYRNRSVIFKGVVVDIEQMDVKVGRCGYHTYQIIRHPGGAGVLPVHSDGTVSLIRQLRPAVDTLLLEIPAGRLAPDEAPERCAVRELGEETGLIAEELLPLGMVYSSPGVFDEIVHLYAATGLVEGAAHPEADEDIEVVRLPLAEALEMVSDGRISDSKTVTALARWYLRQQGGNCA